LRFRKASLQIKLIGNGNSSYRRVALKRNAAEVRLLVNALPREDSIIKLDTDREGGQFYAPASYVEPADWEEF